MNPYLFSHLPYAMGQQAPKSGVAANLPMNPEMQALLMQMQQNPLMSATGQGVPQHSWTGSQFNMAPRPMTPPVAPAPPAAAPGAGLSGPGAPVWTQEQFTPQAQGRNAYRQPDTPAPGGYVWNSAFGYWQPQKDYDWENNKGGSE